VGGRGKGVGRSSAARSEGNIPHGYQRPGRRLSATDSDHAHIVRLRHSAEHPNSTAAFGVATIATSSRSATRWSDGGGGPLLRHQQDGPRGLFGSPGDGPQRRPSARAKDLPFTTAAFDLIPTHGDPREQAPRATRNTLSPLEDILVRTVADGRREFLRSRDHRITVRKSVLAALRQRIGPVLISPANSHRR